jgi:hypothetical protein
MSTTQYLYTQRKDNTNEVTIAPNITDLDVTNTYEYLTNDTTLRQALPSDIISNGEIQAAIDFRNAFKQGDVITAVNVFLANANSVYFKQADFSLENILYWYQKLKLSNKEIISYQSQVSYYGENILSNQLAGGSLFTRNAYNSGSFNQNNYFDNISDCIGIIANSKYIQLDSTLPLFDINQQYYGVPIPYSASIENKMSATARNVAFDLSQKTTMLMRRNLFGIGYTNPTLQQNMNADASTSHGLNLINDLPTFVTINESLGMLKDKLSSVFAEAKVFGFVQYMCNIANETAMNLRDIFPRTPGDRDFTVITSAENAEASQAIVQQEANEALAEQTLYAQQQGFNTITASTINTNNGQTADSSSGDLSPVNIANKGKLPSGAPAPTDDAYTNYLYSMAARESGFSEKEAMSNRYNLAGNNTNVAKYGATDGADWGYYQMNQDQVKTAIKKGMDPNIAAALNNGNGAGGYTFEQQTQAVGQYIKLVKPQAYNAAKSGNYAAADSVLKGQWPSLPGGLSYRSGNDGIANNYRQPVSRPTTTVTSTTAPRPGAA